MTVEKWTPERRRERTRGALIDAARHVFAHRGFEGASLDEIAETAGYTRGAIYKHFTDKEDLFLAVFEDFNERVLDEFAEQNRDASMALDVDAIASTWMHALSGGDEMWALNAEWRLYEFRNPSVRERSASQRARTRDTVARFIEHNSAVLGIRLKHPADEVATLLLDASDGFFQAARVDPEAERHFATFLQLFLPTVIEVDSA